MSKSGTVALNNHLQAVRSALLQHVEDCDESELWLYVAAVNLYLGELLWMSDIPLDEAVPVVTRTIRRAYEVCELEQPE